MGDRANVCMIQRKEKTAVWMYTHWCGHELPERVRNALRRGKDRWDDEAYLGRVIFQGIIGDNDSITGFGLTTYKTDNEHPIIVIDSGSKTVALAPESACGDDYPERLTRKWTFQEFADLPDDFVRDFWNNARN